MSGAYLVNEEHNKPVILNVPTENGCRRAFDDISMLDLACVKLGPNFDEIIREYNPQYNLDGTYRVLDSNTRYNKLKNRFALNADTEESKEVLDRFSYFSYERNNNMKSFTGKSLECDDELDSYIEYLISKIYEFNHSEKATFYNPDGLLPKIVIDLLKVMYTSKDITSGKEYFNKNHRLFQSLLSSYHLLRCMTIMYLQVLLGKSGEVLSELDSKDTRVQNNVYVSSTEINKELRSYTLKYEREVRKELKKIDKKLKALQEKETIEKGTAKVRTDKNRQSK